MEVYVYGLIQQTPYLILMMMSWQREYEQNSAATADIAMPGILASGARDACVYLPRKNRLKHSTESTFGLSWKRQKSGRQIDLSEVTYLKCRLTIESTVVIGRTG